ncbi:MAG TPA: hypothetical protein VGG64_26295 [Pirellulales bacterium]|jgi:hypothetical protein
MVNRIGTYFTKATPAETLERAREALAFCDAILRIHLQAGRICEDELAGLRLLELWSIGIVQQFGN